MSYKQMAVYQTDLRRTGKWPSLYATVNLREALSEYMGEYVMGTEFKLNPDFVNKIGAPFLTPSEDELNWLRNMQFGMVFMGNKDYESALARFEESIQKAPWAPMPYLYTAHCLMHFGKDYARSDQMIGKAIACFDAAGIPSLEPDTKLLVPLRAGVLAERGDYATAIKLLDQVLSETPAHREALTLRSWCQFYRGSLAQSAQDYYLAKCGAEDIYWALFNAPASRSQARAATTSGAQSIDEDRRSIAAAIKRIQSLEKEGNRKSAMTTYKETIKKIEALEARLARSRIAK